MGACCPSLAASAPEPLAAGGVAASGIDHAAAAEPEVTEVAKEASVAPPAFKALLDAHEHIEGLPEALSGVVAPVASKRSPDTQEPLEVLPEALPGVNSVAVVGGGLAGLACAYFLARQGKQVEVFERSGRMGAESALGPAGVAAWKPVRRGPKFFQGVAMAGEGDVGGSPEFCEGTLWQLLDTHLMRQAREACSVFLAENPDAQPVVHSGGLLYVLDKDLFEQNKTAFADDPSMTFFTKDEFEKTELFSPMFAGCDYHGVLWSSEEGAVDPRRFALYLSNKVESLGGKLHVNSTIAGLEEADELGKVFAFVQETGAGKKFDAAVLAVGAVHHPGEFLKASRVRDPVDEIYGAKGYSVTGRMPAGYLKTAVVDAVDAKVIKPWKDAQGNCCIRAGGITDAFDPRAPLVVSWDRLRELKQNQFVKQVFERGGRPRECGAISGSHMDTLFDATVEEDNIEVWTGVQPVSRRGQGPLLRWAKGRKRILVVSGFGSNGYVMCWHVGPRVARLMGD